MILKLPPLNGIRLPRQSTAVRVFWQITLPLVVLAVIFLALTVMVSLSGAGYQSRWADISAIWCLCPNLFVLLLCVGLLGGCRMGCSVCSG